MTLLLAGDTGGTKTILRLVEASESAGLRTIDEGTYHSGDFPDLVPMVSAVFGKNELTNSGKSLFCDRRSGGSKYC